MNKVVIDYILPRETDIYQFSKIHLSLANDRTCKLDLDNCHFENLYNYAQDVESTAFEFYLFSVLIYNIDKLLPRKKYSLDGWCREITFDFQVKTPKLWNSQKIEICNMLSFLTGDVWNVNFIKSQNLYTYITPVDINEMEFKPKKVCLFSGGMDSLIGTYNLLIENKKPLLVSHYDSTMTGPNSDQENIVNSLESKYKRYKEFDWVFNRVGAIKGNNSQLETTFRSRSILFIGMASYLAHNLTPSESFYIPENGTISLNIPLSPSRRSSCSTKTTHPHVLLSLNKIFVGLGINTSIENPYEFLTKGEMLQPLVLDTFFKSLVELSNSCGKSGHKRWWYIFAMTSNRQHNPDHCGKCMPCMYRRAALSKVSWDNKKYYGDNIFDATHWSWKNEPGHKRLKDVKTFLRFIAKEDKIEEVKRELLINGSLPLDKLDNYAKVVIRTKSEIRTWLNLHSTESNYKEIKIRANL